MKLKNMWKRFWTLDVHNHEGFTLVELIIVIAILAILSTGAIAGYSAYVTSANKTADEALAAEIENIMIMAYYNGTLKDGASVVVHFGDVDAQADPSGTDLGAAQAMADAYGENWQTVLRLKWAGWKDEMSVAANSEMMQAVKDSSFTPENLKPLLGQVQAVVDLASGALENNYGTLTITDGLLLDAANRANITLVDGKLQSAEDAQKLTNALVFSVAGDVTQANLNQDEFTDAWNSYVTGSEFEYEGMNEYTGAAIEYAATLSLAQYLDAQAKADGKTTSFAADLQSDESAKTNRNDFKDNMIAALMTDHGYSEEEVVGMVMDYTENGTPTDSKAFLAYMNGVDASSESMISSGNLNADNFFDNDSVVNYVKDYVSIGDALEGVDVEDGAFVFYFNEATGSVACLPLDY